MLAPGAAARVVSVAKAARVVAGGASSLAPPATEVGARDTEHVVDPAAPGAAAAEGVLLRRNMQSGRWE